MRHPSLAARAALAVVLLIGFYVLAAAIIVALLYVPYAEVTYLHRLDPRIAIFTVVGAGAIFWGILPRFDRFEAPGPVLERAGQPRLFAAFDDVARASEQAMPVEVYLVPNLNAWVSQRGGLMGFGSRRVMGLGLPLLQTLTVSQLRAVLAHEFGHYHGGDTALGPWIYKTRLAIGRTLEGLSRHTPLLMKPFEWYGKAFLRITHAISRRQEFAADSLAARVSGTAIAIAALKSIHRAGMAFAPYWHTEVIPAIERGFLPPVADGFRRFVGAPAIAESVTSAFETEMHEGKADPYDTHPPLRERIGALESSPAHAAVLADNEATAISLVENVPALERAMLDRLVREKFRGKLAPLTWEEAGERIWVPVWREQCRAIRDRLEGLTPAMLPALAADRDGLAAKLRLVARGGGAPDQIAEQSGHALGAAIAVALRDRGFAVRALPGHPVLLERGDLTITPFSALGDLTSGVLAPDRWREDCERAGIIDLDLGTIDR